MLITVHLNSGAKTENAFSSPTAQYICERVFSGMRWLCKGYETFVRQASIKELFLFFSSSII